MQTILVAVDGSARALGVVKAAAELALALKAHVVLFRAFEVPPDLALAGATERVNAFPAYLEKEARDQLAALVANVPGFDCDVRVERATQPWRAILAAADTADADLIMLGSHGYHGWDRFLGTTAAKVANVSHRSVFVVHERR